MGFSVPPSYIDIDHLSDHCLIAADVVGRVPKPIISCTSRNIRAVNAVMFGDELHRSSLFTQLADTVETGRIVSAR